MDLFFTATMPRDGEIRNSASATSGDEPSSTTNTGVPGGLNSRQIAACLATNSGRLCVEIATPNDAPPPPAGAYSTPSTTTCTATSGESKRKHQAVPRTRTGEYSIHGSQLSGTRRGGNNRERGQVSDAPAVNNLGTERDLVVALEVAVAVRVTVTDQLQADLLLHTPADSGEVAHDTEDAGGGSGHAGSAHGLRDRSAVALQLRRIGAVGQRRVQLATIRVALLRERDRERRVQRQIRRNVARTENQGISRVHREIRGRTSS